ncbi:helix-turn-helix domain-containing protein [Acetobacter conturbans]|uniref:Helix-turn-helix domain-containing protein n=1 Tax=Acetobacter conturbans TaxID=1737472 RepID=A0ABX0JY46_9PROT|nr:helix-turn-helix domain-containing protein [Acetobacter conturbans]NHN88426.1 helix-turn-helix domain-containing protein [Acetobacter conturbans]NHN88427.1 helix-turn-helix domain-containing protein [Acetobacter conturbans]
MVKKFESARAESVEKAALDLYGKGKSIRAISDQIGASRSYVHRLLMRRRTEELTAMVSRRRVAHGNEPLAPGNAISMGAISFHNRRYVN